MDRSKVSHYFKRDGRLFAKMKGGGNQVVEIRRVKGEIGVLMPNARTDCAEFFAKTQVLTEKRPHHHFLVFVRSKHAVTVRVVDAARKLAEFDHDCPVMVQWPGTWRSDWFKTTVGELLAAREARR